MIIASVISLFLPLLVQSLLPDPQNAKHYDPSGQIILRTIPVMGFILTCVGLIAVLIVFFSVDESFHLYNSNSKKERVTLRETFRRMAQPAKDHKYRNLVFTGFFMNISGSIFGFLLFPFQTYLLEFQQAEFLLYVIISLSGKLSWYVVWRGIPLGASLIHEAAVRKKTSDVDETITTISGSYYGFSMFVSSLGAAVFQIVIGLILTGANKENPIIITILFSSQGFFYIIAIYFLRRIKLVEPVEIDTNIPQIEVP
jgi:Na+/melibiose symporter-like transporter